VSSRSGNLSVVMLCGSLDVMMCPEVGTRVVVNSCLFTLHDVAIMVACLHCHDPRGMMGQ
jgi:hypothetical protein